MSLQLAPLLYGFALFLSSALFFILQPILGRTLLPHLGGNPIAWNVCLIFFQATLLAGYVHAGLLHQFRGLRWQPWWQLLMLGSAVTLLFTGVLGDSLLLDLAPRLNVLDTAPIVGTLALLIVVIGFPYLALAAVGPLLQRWFAHLDHPRASDPYFLFVASNLGGLTALVLYPLAIEPESILRGQWLAWKLALCGLSVLLFLTAFYAWRSPRNPELEPIDKPNDPDAPAIPLLIGRGRATWPRRLHWLAAVAIPVAMLMAVTDYLTLDVAPAPFLWMLPLALYLFAFSQAFARVAPFQRGGAMVQRLTQLLYGVILVAFVTFLVVAAESPGQENAAWTMRWSVLLFAVLLFMPSSWLQIAQPLSALAIIFVRVNVFWGSAIGIGPILFTLVCFYLTARLCLERLAEDRPAATDVTAYYTWIGVGGLAGGLLQVLVVPFVFRWGFVELAFFAALATMLRPAWLQSGLVDWTVCQLFFRPGDFEAAKTEHPAKRRIALAFDFILPGIAAVAATLLFLTRHGLRPGGGFAPGWHPALREVFTLLGDVPLIVAILCAALFIARPIRFGLALSALVCLSWIGFDRDANQLLRQRTHFGLLRVRENQVQLPAVPGEIGRTITERSLTHGAIHHGSVISSPSDWRRYPTTYYHRKGPVGHVMRRLEYFHAPPVPHFGAKPAPAQDADFWLNRNRDNSRDDVRVFTSLIGLGASPIGASAQAATVEIGARWTERPIALVGLGAGSMFAYARPTQWVEAYELDPTIIALSEGKTPIFPAVQSARARGVEAKLIPGDARRSLTRAKRERFFQVMIVDAFNSDAIPTHLLTTQALELYFQKLTRDGVICIHTSNRYLDLPKVLDAAAKRLNVAMTVLEAEVDPDRPLPAYFTSQWVMLARTPATLQRWTDGFERNNPAPIFNPGGFRGQRIFWTDEQSSLRPAVRADQHWARMIHGMLIVILLLGLALGLVELIASMGLFGSSPGRTKASR